MSKLIWETDLENESIIYIHIYTASSSICFEEKIL